MTTTPKVILASASPRRSQLLAVVGLAFDVVPAAVDESVFSATNAIGVACELAEAKARAVAEDHPEAVVIAADTIVVLRDAGGNEELLNKPVDRDDATRMLTKLQGREHTVVTGYCLIQLSESRKTVDAVASTVRFKPLSAAEISFYIDSGEPMDKAGSYGIQEIGAFLVAAVSGSYTNVVGLPLAEVVDELARWGVWSPELLARGS